MTPSAAMTTSTTARADLATRWKVWRFQRILNHNTDCLTERFGATETTGMRREMLAEYKTLPPRSPTSAEGATR